MRRTRAGGDARLHDRWSIGVGGHLNPGDGDVAGGLRREWARGARRGLRAGLRPVGLLNDDTTPVGAVHVGFVYVADAGGRPVAIRETDKLEGAFADDRARWPRSGTRPGDLEPPRLRRADRVTPGSGGLRHGTAIRTRCDTHARSHEPHDAASPPPARPHPHAAGLSCWCVAGGIAQAAARAWSCNSPRPASWTAHGAATSEEGIATAAAGRRRRGGRPARHARRQHRRR